MKNTETKKELLKQFGFSKEYQAKSSKIMVKNPLVKKVVKELSKTK